MRFLSYTLADPKAETPPPGPETYEAMGKFVDEAMKSGAVVATGGLGDPAEGFKVSLTDGTYTVTDGPFTEAKELVGGWALIDVRDRDEAVELTKRFLSILGFGECTLRQVFGPE